jgi:hypothetical protein
VRDLGLVKWSQPPVEIDPNLDPDVPPVFCGWDQPSKSTVLQDQRRVWQIALDDFHCLGPIPVTRLRWWGSYKNWDQLDLPATLPEAWQITFWINRPEKVDAVPFAEKPVWRLDIPAERVHVQPVGIDQFPQQPAETCFVYELALGPDEWFWQAEFPSEQDIYWIGIAAVYAQGAPERNHWGWMTRSEPWRAPAQVIVLYGDGPGADTQFWPGMLQPVVNNLLCGQERGYDMAFELLTEPPWVHWDQLFAGLREWPRHEDIESQGTSVRGEESIGRIVADDWLCERDSPVIAAAWWGSYIGYGYEACRCEQEPEPPRPDYFLLRIWTNVPASRDVLSLPGEVVWEYRAFDYDEVLVGYDKNPDGEPNEPVFRYSVRLPDDVWFRPNARTGIYWFSVVAVYTDPLPQIVHPWGWTDHAHVFESGAFVIDYRARAMPEWRPLRDPEGRPLDMSFTLFTRPE